MLITLSLMKIMEIMFLTQTSLGGKEMFCSPAVSYYVNNIFKLSTQIPEFRMVPPSNQKPTSTEQRARLLLLHNEYQEKIQKWLNHKIYVNLQ